MRRRLEKLRQNNKFFLNWYVNDPSDPKLLMSTHNPSFQIFLEFMMMCCWAADPGINSSIKAGNPLL
jgi:hypothetical protein